MSDIRRPDALIGARLGSCTLERPLGVGGMGAVYLARQERPRRQVAVKVLRRELSADAQNWPVFLARFRREADATAALDSANIIPIYEFGEEDDIAYLVMPYFADGSLADLLARSGKLPIQRVVAYVDQIAAALDYAHEHGIVHRDVKPSNLLLHPDGRLLLSDFGIARPLDSADLPAVRGAASARRAPLDNAQLTQMGAAMGTPEYMAPEQIRNGPVGPAADIYALGALTYTMLTGETPFAGGTIGEVLARQLREAPPPLRTARPDAPPRLEEAVFWALAKHPVDRPPSAGAFARAVREGSRERTLASFLNRATGQRASFAGITGLGIGASGGASGGASSGGLGTSPRTPAAAGAGMPPAARLAGGTIPLPTARKNGLLGASSADAASSSGADMAGGVAGSHATGMQPMGTMGGAANRSGAANARGIDDDPADATLYEGNYAGVATARAGMGGIAGMGGGRYGAPPPGGSAFAGSAPAWPGHGISSRPHRRQIGWLLPITSVAALILVLIASLAFVNFLSGASSGSPFFDPFGSGQPAANRTPTVHMSPTPTVTPSPSPTATPAPPANWLSVSPQSINLACKGDKKSATLYLVNLGPETINWQAQLPAFAGVHLTPTSGNLHPEERVAITVTNSSFVPRTGTITFATDNANAGQPATVDYATQGCGFQTGG